MLTEDSLRSLAHSMSRRTKVDVDDLYQEGLIAVWKAEKSWDGVQDLEARRIFKARCAMIDYVRAYRFDQRRKTAQPVFIAFNKHIPCKEKSNLDKVIAKNMVEFVKNANISDNAKFAILETTLNSRTKADVSKELGLSESTVGQMINRSLKELKRQYEIRYFRDPNSSVLPSSRCCNSNN